MFGHVFGILASVSAEGMGHGDIGLGSKAHLHACLVKCT